MLCRLSFSTSSLPPPSTPFYSLLPPSTPFYAFSIAPILNELPSIRFSDCQSPGVRLAATTALLPTCATPTPNFSLPQPLDLLIVGGDAHVR